MAGSIASARNSAASDQISTPWMALIRWIASTSPTPARISRTTVAAGRITRTVSDRPSSDTGRCNTAFPSSPVSGSANGRRPHTPDPMAPPQPTSIVRARAGVAVYERGAGEPVLLVGGFPDHAIGLLPVAEALAAAGFRAIVAAYPGYPPSEPLPDDDYAIPSVAADLVTVMESLGAPRFSVVGHGWGALYGYRIASAY